MEHPWKEHTPHTLCHPIMRGNTSLVTLTKCGAFHALSRGLAWSTTMSGACSVPIVDGLFTPPADAADEYIRLRQLVSCQGTFGDAEPLRHLGQAEIPFHALRPVMMAVAASSPADSPASPAAIGLPPMPASREIMPATPDSVHHVFDCLFIVGLMRYGRGRGSGYLGYSGPLPLFPLPLLLVLPVGFDHLDDDVRGGGDGEDSDGDGIIPACAGNTYFLGKDGAFVKARSPII